MPTLRRYWDSLVVTIHREELYLPLDRVALLADVHDMATEMNLKEEEEENDRVVCSLTIDLNDFNADFEELENDPWTADFFDDSDEFQAATSWFGDLLTIVAEHHCVVSGLKELIFQGRPYCRDKYATDEDFPAFPVSALAYFLESLSSDKLSSIVLQGVVLVGDNTDDFARVARALEDQPLLAELCIEQVFIRALPPLSQDVDDEDVTPQMESAWLWDAVLQGVVNHLLVEEIWINRYAGATLIMPGKTLQLAYHPCLKSLKIPGFVLKDGDLTMLQSTRMLTDLRLQLDVSVTGSLVLASALRNNPGLKYLAFMFLEGEGSTSMDDMVLIQHHIANAVAHSSRVESMILYFAWQLGSQNKDAMLKPWTAMIQHQYSLESLWCVESPDDHELAVMVDCHEDDFPLNWKRITDDSSQEERDFFLHLNKTGGRQRVLEEFDPSSAQAPEWLDLFQHMGGHSLSYLYWFVREYSIPIVNLQRQGGCATADGPSHPSENSIEEDPSDDLIDGEGAAKPTKTSWSAGARLLYKCCCWTAQPSNEICPQ